MPGTPRRPPVVGARTPPPAPATETGSVLDLLMSPSAVPPGLRVLQVGGDNGTMARAMADAGLSVLVVTPAPVDAAALRVALSASNPQVDCHIEVLCSDLDGLETAERFRTVVLPAALVTGLDAHAMEQLIATAIDLLAPGGALVVSTVRVVRVSGEDGPPTAAAEASPRLTPARISEQLRSHSLSVTYQRSVPDGVWPGMLSVIIGASRPLDRGRPPVLPHPADAPVD